MVIVYSVPFGVILFIILGIYGSFADAISSGRVVNIANFIVIAVESGLFAYFIYAWKEAVKKHFLLFCVMDFVSAAILAIGTTRVFNPWINLMRDPVLSHQYKLASFFAPLHLVIGIIVYLFACCFVWGAKIYSVKKEEIQKEKFGRKKEYAIIELDNKFQALALLLSIIIVVLAYFIIDDVAIF